MRRLTMHARVWALIGGCVSCGMVLVGSSQAVDQRDTVTTIVGGGTALPVSGELIGSEVKAAGGTALATDGTRIYFTTRDSRGSKISFVNGTTGNGRTLISTRPTASGATALFAPRALATGPGGALYVADGDAVYRYMTQSSCPSCGTRVAGTGVAGFSGDGAAATAARLSEPSGLVVAPSGRLYISDTGNHRVRYVENGTIETYAGSGTAGNSADGEVGLSARLDTPRGLAVDKAGNLFIATRTRIRKITVSTGIISTVEPVLGGTAVCGGQAEEIRDLAIDPLGNLYFSQRGFNRVWKVNPGTIAYTISSTGGCSNAGFAGDGGEFSKSKLSGPRGLVIDGQGSLFVYDVGNSRIRRVRNIPPQAGFTITPDRTTASAPFTATFAPSGSYDGGYGKIIRYAWYFGAGRAPVAYTKPATVTRTFDRPGVIQVTLTVTDDAGATAVATKTLTIR